MSEPIENVNHCMVPPPATLKQRLAWRFFPSEWVELPDRPPAAFKATDVVHLEMVTEFSFLDRLRILVSGRVKTSARMITENTVGGAETHAVTFPLPPRLLQPELLP